MDIQLKILQTLLSILTYCKGMHGDTLGTALLLCFKLQDSRVNVVSSTAAATLRQAIMVVFDRIGVEEEGSEELVLGEEVVKVTPAALDGYEILSDLCLLTLGGQSSSSLSLWSSSGKEKPRMLKLSALQRTFGLELIESIMSGYEAVVKSHPELLYLLRHSLHPLIIRLQGEKPSFPVALRINRLIYVLVRSYSEQLPSEVETYLLSLIRMGVGDEEDKREHKKEAAPWVHVLALEILRGICGDSTLLRSIWAQYDGKDGPKLFQKIVAALGRLINEKPALLGVGSQMHGLGVPASSTENVHAGYFDMGIGMVASAASVGVSAVSAALGSGGGLGPHSYMKQRLIEQHDKAEAPVVPETYIYLLAVQSLDAVSDSIYSAAGREDTREAARGMADCAWPALLAGLSYSIGTNLSDSLFAEVLGALQDFTVACGVLDLSTPRDAFLTTLARYAVPPSVVSAMQSYLDNPAGPRTTGGVINADALGLTALTGGNAGPPSLSDRNLACLRSLIAVARTLASSIGPAWHDVLETLQNANYLLASSSRVPQQRRNVSGMSGQISVPPSPSPQRDSMDVSSPRHQVLQDLDTDNIQAAVNSLFDDSRELDDEAFTVFITALCRLSAEMIGMDVEGDSTRSTTPSSTLSPPMDKSAGRRTSGINVSHSIKSGERSFGLSKLRMVSVLNLDRLVGRDPEVGWNVVTRHILGVARHLTAASVIRLQASETLSDLLMAALRTSQEPRVQHQVFDVLVRQVSATPVSNTPSTDYDVRSTGFETLNQILESFGHSLVVGWSTIFGMLNSVCDRPDGRPAQISSHRGDANLVRIAFPSLTLICTDFLSSLDADAMRQCIACLGFFGRQHDDVNITLAAVNLLWTVSDAVQKDKKDLWLQLLVELLQLAQDSRLEVRSGAMQTLFRCVELYGANLSPELWEDVLWKVVFPLLETLRGDESQVLALTSVGSIFGMFPDQISSLPTSTKVYETLLGRLQKSFISEPRNCGTAALRVMERVLSTSKKDASYLESTWDTFCLMGKALNDGEPYTQENLVALVRVASLLQQHLPWTDDKARESSAIMRSAIEYTRSPDYRPDVDSMSPLQQAVADLTVKSKSSPSLTLADLTEYASLAYAGDGAGKITYVALSKYSMPAMAKIFAKVADDLAVYEDGTVDAMLGAYALPIKLKYDCPAPSKYGSDPPLWRTAMTTFVTVLDQVMPALDKKTDIPKERFEAIWEQIMGAYAGVLLADDDGAIKEDETFVLSILAKMRAAVTGRMGDERVPPRIIEGFAETLSKASQLYHYDVGATGGTTAPVVPEAQEEMRYWAFDELIAHASGTEDVKLAGLFAPAVLKRFQTTLQRFLGDVKVRGQMPFSRVREDELLYVLRHLITITINPGPVEKAASGTAMAKACGASPRAHLFRHYKLLLELAFVPVQLPSTWMLPSEQARLFSNGSADETIDVGDDTDLVEVSARDLARRCLELVGDELGLGK